MKTLIFTLFFAQSFLSAQKLPNCIEKLNHKTDLTTTQFERPLKLSDNRTVFEFSVKSVRRCMDCYNGRIYYDENCKQVARFGMGRGVDQFVAEGYTFGDFGQVKPPIQNSNREKTENVIFNIEKIIWQDLEAFQTGDQIEVSPEQGLKHFHKEKLINTYKIIPRKLSSVEINQPRVYFIEPLQLYFKIVNSQLWVIKTKYKDESSSNKINDNDWIVALNLKKHK